MKMGRCPSICPFCPVSFRRVAGAPNLYQFDLDFKEVDAVLFLTLKSALNLENEG